MSFNSRLLLERLQELESVAGAPKRYIVAFSGGMDSTVLLHAIAELAGVASLPLLAAHVDHGIHQDSAQWDADCREVAGSFGVEYCSQKVLLNWQDGSGPESTARDARYAWLGSLVQDGDWLLSAHHENDQAETLLLNLMRGSGLTGLAGMGAVRRFSRGYLLRPLLGVPGSDIRDYAVRHRLRWNDDPSNEDTNLDRNYLRKEVMPMLAARWPAVSARLRKSADLAAEAGDLLAELAEIDLAASPSPDRLELRSLAHLSGPRLRNAIRHAVRRCGLPPPPATRLYQIEHELIPAKDDAQPLVEWPGVEIRRYRDALYILADTRCSSALRGGVLYPGESLDLGEGNGLLALQPCDKGGISPSIAAKGLEVRFRSGGEAIRLPNRMQHNKLKKLLQDASIVPWMRERLPLLFSGKQLVAVANLWIDADCIGDDGFMPRWINSPPVH
jgi:tRNA(Ile)-lysidine synthase